jgi:hypothetical protein
LALEVSRDATRFPFVAFAQALVEKYGGTIEETFIWRDEIYWDIRISGHLVTLHCEHNLGVFLCAADEQSEDALRQVVPFVERFVRGRADGR